jgi:hypothetical protein
MLAYLHLMVGRSRIATSVLHFLYLLFLTLQIPGADIGVRFNSLYCKEFASPYCERWSVHEPSPSFALSRRSGLIIQQFYGVDPWWRDCNLTHASGVYDTGAVRDRWEMMSLVLVRKQRPAREGETPVEPNGYMGARDD